MKYGSRLLYELSQAVDTQRLDGSEAELLVPSILHPIITVPLSHREHAAFSTTEVQRRSFDTRLETVLAALAADSNVVVATLGQGLWRLVLTMSGYSDFTSAPSAGGNRVMLRSPAGDDFSLLRTFDIANVPQHQTIAADFLFTVDGWLLGLFMSATAAANTKVGSLGVVATLLL